MPCAAQTFTYDCDTPGGHFSKLENVANGPDYAITGEVGHLEKPVAPEGLK